MMFSLACVATLSACCAAAATITVCASGCNLADFNKALETAKPGDTITLKAGEVYKGNFWLPYKEGSSYITIQSSRAAELPPIGYRVTPAHKRLMATIEQGNRGTPVVFTGAAELKFTVDAATNRLPTEYNPWSDGEAVACRTPTGAPLPSPLQRDKVYFVRDKDPKGLRLAATPGGPALRFTASSTEPFLCAQAQMAHHYRFRGIEFVSTPAGPSEYNLVALGTGAEATRSAIPHDFEFIQVYIHGQPMRTDTSDGPRNCLVLNTGSAVVRDSYISDCKHMGEESKAITGWQAPGPLIIRNNYIEGASIGLLLGGAPPAIPNLVVGDAGTEKNPGVVVQGNHFSKPYSFMFMSGPGQTHTPAGACKDGLSLDTLSGQLYECSNGAWKQSDRCADGEYYRRADVAPNCAAGACWVCGNGTFHQVSAPYRGEGYVVKGLIETKSCINCVISGNVFEKTWGGPISVPMQVLNAGYNWNRGENVLFADNLIRDTTAGYHNGTEGHNRFTYPNRRIRIVNNLFYRIGVTDNPHTSTLNAQRLAMFQGPCIECSFEHNTLLSASTTGAGVLFAGGEPLEDFRFDNNIVTGLNYGILGEGHNGGCEAIDALVGKSAFKNNLLINNTGALSNGSVGKCAVKTTIVPAKTELFTGEGNYRLKHSSPYSASCQGKCAYTSTDGKDLGADIDEIEAATSGAIEGTPTWAERMKLKVQPAARDALLTYEAPEDKACRVSLYTNAARTALDPDTATAATQSDDRAGNQNAGRSRRFRLGAAAPLAPHKEYWYVLQCRDWKVPGYFRTADQ